MPRGAVDLFCGCGGASLGLQEADFEVLAAADVDPVACKTYERNLGLSPLQEDLTEVSWSELLDHFGVEDDDVDLLAGCPPCQNFSSLRRTTPWPEGAPKDELLLTFLGFIEEAEPPMVLFENVPGILTTDDGEYMDYFLEKMEELDYGVAWDKINAADYGVPQLRTRVVAFGVRGHESNDLEMPEPTHAEAPENSSRPEWKKVKHALKGLPNLEAGEEAEEPPNHKARDHRKKTLDLIRKIPENGGSRTDLPKEMWLDCHKNLEETGAGNVYGRMRWGEPAPTMTTRCTNASSGRFLHPEENRSITVREAARIQTFPDNFEFPEKTQHAERVVGNAVPPLLIESLVDRVF